MVVAGDPGDGAVGKRADDGSKPQRHVPEAVELGQARARREDRDHGSACGLGRAHGEAREIGGDPELPALGREAATAIIAIQTQSVPASASLWPMRSCT